MPELTLDQKYKIQAAKSARLLFRASASLHKLQAADKINPYRADDARLLLAKQNQEMGSFLESYASAVE